AGRGIRKRPALARELSKQNEGLEGGARAGDLETLRPRSPDGGGGSVGAAGRCVALERPLGVRGGAAARLDRRLETRRPVPPALFRGSRGGDELLDTLVGQPEVAGHRPGRGPTVSPFSAQVVEDR